MITEDVIVYLHPDGTHYVALIGEQWRKWPAVENGCRARKPASENDVDTNRKLPSDLAALALRLSGVTP